jgi:hypothetical protein
MHTLRSFAFYSDVFIGKLQDVPGMHMEAAVEMYVRHLILVLKQLDSVGAKCSFEYSA